MKPINSWCDIINSKNREQELFRDLKEIYRCNPPVIAAIIMNSSCSSRCQHCIYAPDFHRHNKNMTSIEWKEAFKVIHDDLGLKRFIFDGRALSKECIFAINHIKNNFSDVKVGLISDGISVQPLVEMLIDLPLDWLDVSVDGLEKDHDIQRNYKGAFKKTFDVLIQLKDANNLGKINILTCLTTLNKGSILKMIKLFNGEGFKNFFITPVGILKEYRPDPNLQLQKEDFVNFLDELAVISNRLSDTWLAVDIFEAIYASAIKELRPELFDEFMLDDEHFELVKKHGNNEVHICYYPSSLTGVREFIINSDGNIIPPKVMAMGSIPKKLIIANILNLKNGRNIFHKIVKEDAFTIFEQELLEERKLLKPLTELCTKKSMAQPIGL